MDEEAFRRFLTRKGKKAHVVDGLVAQVRGFETYLTRERHIGLEAAGAADLHAYVAALDAQKPGSARKAVRGVALYYQSLGNAALADVAFGVREQRIAKTRKPFPLKEFRGVDAEHIRRLRAAGIVHAGHMLEAGSTLEARERLAAATGIPPAAVLELVKLSDLARIGGIKGIRARLYCDAGADTPETIAGWEPEPLHAMLADFVARSGFDGTAPLPKEVQYTVATARRLPRVVEY
jgi:hypothetical protein